MLRVQEICKEQGITMQDLAKKMGVTYQALYAAVSGNPTIGKLGDIAKNLDVPIQELFEKNYAGEEIIGFIKIGNIIHEIKSLKDFKELAQNI